MEVDDSGALPNSIYALSYTRQEHKRIAAFSQYFVIKGRMASFKVVSVDVTSNRSSGFLDVVILRQINWLCESKSVNSNFRTSMISIILRRMPSFGIRPYEYNYQKIRPMSRASVKDRCLFYP